MTRKVRDDDITPRNTFWGFEFLGWGNNRNVECAVVYRACFHDTVFTGREVDKKIGGHEGVVREGF